ncbi:MAG TPA: zinc ribbon domain-containing protein [Solirubrobacteraceae bacterium]|nr:zinc ribbon domain-containing protein [Solirubrobacteraceae bacterium]
MLTLAYFGIESSGLNLVVDLLILFIVVLYLSLIYWTYADARRRILDPMLVGCATAASLFPFVGTIVYMILRPPEYLDDVHERELEMQAAEARLHELDHSLCPHCDYRVERDFVRCPSCLHKLKERCVNCSRPLDQAWTICPYCETEVAPAAPARRTRRRRTQAAIDAEEAQLAASTRPETARAKAARERSEREAATVIEADVVDEDGDEQDTLAAAEPAQRSRSARASTSSSRRARPST